MAAADVYSSAQNDSLTLLDLPEDPLADILSFLDYKDLVSCCSSCHRLRDSSLRDSLWKRHCSKYWLEQRCDAEGWRHTFIRWYKDWGHYIDSYRHLRHAWNLIEEFTQEHCTAIYSSLRDGLSESDLSHIERELGYSLPMSLRCSYRIHDGQAINADSGLLGSMSLHSYHRSECLLSLHLAEQVYSTFCQIEGCLPVTYCMESRVGQYVVISPDRGYLPDNVFYPCRNFDENSDNMAIFITGKCFQEWLCTYAEELHSGAFPVRYEQIYRFYEEPSCFLETGSIRVEVATCFMPELTTVSPAHFFHTYNIKISMSKSAQQSASCRLETRHWTVTDGNGAEEHVNGYGVVGENPTMRPGDTFDWTSCTVFKTSHGSMYGHFTMLNLQSGESLDVKCPVFHMKCLPYQDAEEIKGRACAIKKNK